MKQTYDVVVLGAGSGGLTAAVGFNKAGRSVLLVEAEHMGGECTNNGCIPSKALLHHANAFYSAQMIAGDTTKSETYRQAAFRYVRDRIDHILATETPETFQKRGIDVVRGEGSFTGRRTIRVGETEYHYARAVIATGSLPRPIDIPGLGAEQLLTNQNFFTQSRLPEKLLVVGGGPIGIELAEAMARLGVSVTLLERSGTFAKLDDPSIRPILQNHLESLGITILTNATLNRVKGETAYIIQDDKNTTLLFDKVLLAIGRVPQIPAGLETAGITANEHGVSVNNAWRTTNWRVYAVGDVAARHKFTHVADDAARQVVARVVSRGLLRGNARKAIPKVLYTNPEVAQVGLSWDAAVERYGVNQVRRSEVALAHVDRAVTDSATIGVIVLITRRLTGRVLGAHLMAPRAGELLAPLTLAIDEGISAWRLQRLMYAYPTYSLAIKKVADRFVSEQLSDARHDIVNLLRGLAPKLLAITVWVIGLIALQRYIAESEQTLTQLSVSLFTFISSSMWGPLLYIAAYAVRPVLFIPGTLLTVLAGVFFGLWWGTVYTIIAALASAAVVYVIGRFFGGQINFESTGLSKWVERLRHNAFEATLFMRLVFLPYDLVGYAAGVLAVPFWSYLFATAIGIVLGTVTFVAIGAGIDVNTILTEGLQADIIDAKFFVLSAVVLVTSIVIARVVKRQKAPTPK
jgi:pyruvate/2-oxoglutarate dehydrogenase complex dihydrolipoamide dehydrogenase (E3) component/uncharacterized membrane protein YdjX (TVP38/TMEM64 family)